MFFPVKRRSALILVLLVSASLFLVAPLFAWFPFIASNGQATRWVWNTSCNSGSRPISVVYDSVMDPSTTAWMTGVAASVHSSWNSGLTTALVQSPDFSGANSTVSSVNSYMSSPTPNTIRVVWDSNGSIFSSLGLSTSSVLGVGLGFNSNSSTPQDICSGMVLLNGLLISAQGGLREEYLYFTLQHEIGHVLGLAHSIAGRNTSSNVSIGVFSSSTRPTMYPFIPSPPPAVGTSLRADDEAGKQVLYGP